MVGMVRVERTPSCSQNKRLTIKPSPLYILGKSFLSALTSVPGTTVLFKSITLWLLVLDSNQRPNGYGAELEI